MKMFAQRQKAEEEKERDVMYIKREQVQGLQGPHRRIPQKHLE